ncbi:Gag-Pol polyprotein [Armadillidium vulgare]|nr:Gag-Pol polyprotein [Armadillidium vulgare]
MTQLVCGNCGIEGHFSRMCRSPRNTCNRCGKLGHVGEMCWSVRQPGRGSQVNPGVNDGGSGIGSNVQAIGSQAIGSSNRNVNLGTSGVNCQVNECMSVKVYCGGIEVRALIDTGCMVSVVYKKAYDRMKIREDQKESEHGNIKGISNMFIPVEIKFRERVRIGGIGMEDSEFLCD